MDEPAAAAEPAAGSEAPTWWCEAYGEEGAKVGALCFFAENARDCASPEECASRMAGERVRVFDRIGEMAAAGDPVGQFLAGEFSSPDQLLNGDASEAEQQPGR